MNRRGMQRQLWMLLLPLPVLSQGSWRASVWLARCQPSHAWLQARCPGRPHPAVLLLHMEPHPQQGLWVRAQAGVPPPPPPPPLLLLLLRV